jgi:hypothetical protein
MGAGRSSRNSLVPSSVFYGKPVQGLKAADPCCHVAANTWQNADMRGGPHPNYARRGRLKNNAQAKHCMTITIAPAATNAVSSDPTKGPSPLSKGENKREAGN